MFLTSTVLKWFKLPASTHSTERRTWYDLASASIMGKIVFENNAMIIKNNQPKSKIIKVLSSFNVLNNLVKKSFKSICQNPALFFLCIKIDINKNIILKIKNGMGFNAENNDNISEVKIICENIIKNK